MMEGKRIITCIFALALAVLGKNERKTKLTQNGTNGFMLEVQGTSQRELNLACLYDTQKVEIEQAFWAMTVQHPIKESARKCHDLPSEAWVDKTEEIKRRCEQMPFCSLPASSINESSGHWLVCYSCFTSKPKDKDISTEKDNPSQKTEATAPAIDFGKSFLRSLLRPPWLTEEVRPANINQALAFVKVVEFVAGKMAANLESDQHMEFEVEDVAQINLFSVNFSSSFQRKALIGGIVSLPIIDLELPYQSTDSNSQRMPLAAFIAYKPRSFVSKTLKALEMVTVTFYESDGSKLPSANNHVYLRSPVSLAFKSISEANFGLNSAWICAHYDLQRRMWSSEGCITDLIAKACRCHHLTHFGLLLRPDDQNVGLHHQKPLRMITVGGCCISALALVLTLAFLIYQGKSNDRLRIYKHFSVNLLIVELLMVFGINQTSKGGQNPICLTIGILLHWSLLAAFTWSMLAGFQIYLLLVVIFQADSRSKMQRYRCIGYGVPTILILASVIIDQFSLEGLTYTSNDQCWMRPNMLFLWSFLVPVTTIILINMAMLGLAIYRVCQLDQRPKFLLRQARGLLSLLFILGGTWLIGVANTIFPNLTLTYIFTALNSLQGLLIFVFYVLLSDTFSQILRQFWHWFNEEEIRTNNWNSTTAAVAAK